MHSDILDWIVEQKKKDNEKKNWQNSGNVYSMIPVLISWYDSYESW
jgi:hypothetical protein